MGFQTPSSKPLSGLFQSHCGTLWPTLSWRCEKGLLGNLWILKYSIVVSSICLLSTCSNISQTMLVSWQSNFQTLRKTKTNTIVTDNKHQQQNNFKHIFKIITIWKEKITLYCDINYTILSYDGLQVFFTSKL